MPKQPHSSLVERDQLLNAYFSGLRIFFDNNGGFIPVRIALKKLLYWAFSEGITAQADIPILRSLQKTVTELMENTHKAWAAKVFCNPAETQEVFSYHGEPKIVFYCGEMSDKTHAAWSYYPRFISKRDFLNPYQFFDKFFEYKELIDWKNILHELFHATLSHESVITGSTITDNAIELQDYLFKFLEVSHLIKVRHLDGKLL